MSIRRRLATWSLRPTASTTAIAGPQFDASRHWRRQCRRLQPSLSQRIHADPVRQRLHRAKCCVPFASRPRSCRRDDGERGQHSISVKPCWAAGRVAEASSAPFASVVVHFDPARPCRDRRFHRCRAKPMSNGTYSPDACRITCGWMGSRVAWLAPLQLRAVQSRSDSAGLGHQRAQQDHRDRIQRSMRPS
jgi:hypothetical protein